VAQFFYVGAQVGIWSYLIRYAQQTLPGTSERNAADFLTVALVMFMIGRFAGTALMRYLPPAAAAGDLRIRRPGSRDRGIDYAGSRRPPMRWLQPLSSLSIMFPTIFALGLRGLDDADRKIAFVVPRDGDHRRRHADGL